MNILITGASGFIGRSFMRQFSGHPDVHIHGVARRALDGVPHYSQVDLSRPFTVPIVPDVVIHGAALSSPWGTHAQFQRHNVEATAEVIRFCERHGRPKLVYLSSSSVFYRHEHQFNLSEDSPIGPTFVNTYARSKAQGEQLVREYPGDWVILRPRAVFGPGDTVLFPRILTAARKGKLPLFVNDGPEPMGDLIYIDSLCEYIFRAATRAEVRGDFNLTNAQPVPIQPFLFDVLRRLNIPLPTRPLKVSRAMRMAALLEALWRVLPLRGEPPITRFGVSVFAYSKTFDISRTLAVLGPPSVALMDGVERFVAWQAAQ